MIYTILLLGHIIGVALGVGGAFVSDYLFLTSLRNDKKIDPSEFRLLSAASRVVWLGLGILVVSGFAMLWMGGFGLLQADRFLMKLTLVGVIFVNGLAFHFIHLPFLRNYFSPHHKKNISADGKRMAFVFASGAISVVSWIGVPVLAYWKTIPFEYGEILLGYAVVLVCAISVALVMKRKKFPELSLSIFDKTKNPIVTVASSVIAVFVILGVLYGIQQYIVQPSAPSVTSGVSIELQPKASLTLVGEDEINVTYAPSVPPTIQRNEQKIIDVHLEVIQGVCELDSVTGTLFEVWGYRIAGDTHIECGSPGPVLRGRIGDVMRITLTSDPENTHPHNIDFHAATGPGGGAKALTVAPGETATIEFRLLYAGTFQYHCAFGDVPEHVSRGQYGLLIVDPEKPLPEVDHEWTVMQSEWYLTEPNDQGITETSMQDLLDETPRFITFNGHTKALVGENALVMRTGERARIYFINHGLNKNSNFHPIGSHWDVVYPEGATHPDNRVIYGSQSTLVVTGGGVIVELEAFVPGDLILVDHALSRAFYKGALGIITVLGDQNPEIYEITQPASASHDPYSVNTAQDAKSGHQNGHATNQATEEDVQEFLIQAKDFDYSLKEIKVKQGDTVRLVVESVEGFHDLYLEEYDVKTKGLVEGRKDIIEFTADQKGRFEYYCTIGQHRALGQFGFLVVE